MSRLVFNRDSGAADEYGHLLALVRMFAGEVIDGFAVTAQGSPNMSVQVGATGTNTAKIPTGTSPSSYGYFVAIDTSGGEAVTIATAPTSQPRIDTIVAYVDKSLTPATSPANNPGMLKLASVAGTPNASPSAPNSTAIQTAIGAANPYIILADIAVGVNVTQITSGNITDRRTFFSGKVVVKKTSNSTSSGTGSTAASGLTLTVTAPQNCRELKVTLWTNGLYNTTASANSQMQIWDGTVGSGTLRAIAYGIQGGSSSSGGEAIAFVPVTPGATKTFNAAVQAPGTGTATMEGSSASPTLLFVEPWN